MKPLAGRWRFAAHLGISLPDRPLLMHSADVDPVAQIERAHDLGFAGITDNPLKLRPPEVQRAMGAALRRLGMEMGSFVHNPTGGEAPFFWSAPIADVAAALSETLAAAERIGGALINVILLDSGGAREEQIGRIVDNLGAAAEIVRRAGFRLAIEPASRARVPQALVEASAEVAAIVRAIGRERIGLILDSCHMAYAGDDIAAEIVAQGELLSTVQIADVPGRFEPGAGEIDFGALFGALERIGWSGLVEAEFELSEASAAGETRVIEALAACQEMKSKKKRDPGSSPG